MKPYGDNAADYLKAGFAPIPARGKRTIKNSHHGRGKPWVTVEEAERWAALHARANIAARLPRDVIGIDVDAYGSKPGEETLAALEEELGALPPTVVSTSRLDGVSGIRLFRIPDRYWSVIWPGKAGDGIEIIWTGNRYVIVWPSVHPDTGATYQWYEQDELSGLEPIDGLPDLSILPFLPLDWCDYFARNDAGDEVADVSDTADWIKRHGGGDMCSQMRENVARATESLAINAHDSARDGTLAIAKDCAAGHTGASEAMAVLYRAFAGELNARPGARRSGMRSEWSRHFNGAVRRAVGTLRGAERPSADPCDEVAGISDEFRPVRNSDSILWADDVQETKVSWLQKPLLPFGSIVMTDGDPSQGKTLQTQTAVAKATLGEPLFPFGEHCGRPIKCGMIGAEDDLNSVVLGRLRAAGWERGSRSVAFMKLKKRRGKIEQLTFPDGTNRVRDFIVQGGLELVVIDPITSFLGENVKSHVDASVRAALGPLAQIAKETGCCIWLVRHLNKSNPMQAMYRGGGSIAFSALARSGLITGQLPDSDPGRFGIAQVKCNHSRKMEVTLTYSIQAWEEDEDIPVIVWHGEADITADQLVAGPSKKPGPSSDTQSEISEVLAAMFERNDTWRVGEAIRELKAAGCSTNDKTVSKVRKQLGIVPGQVFGSDGRMESWVWTTNVRKLRGRKLVSDE